ncbi:suppressor APC domain-containing protein 2 [Amia ocellicauda]|uniref:suppressor APC domain-containing protein 2 n=1 Tax=Amia ocellicauda TaxID=2972642 RepID=UPI003463C410
MALIAADRSCKLSGSVAVLARLGASQRAGVGGGSSGDSRMQPGELDLSTDGLPRAFLHSLRTLFDILDDTKRGYVHISEIESRWQGADTRELPRGVLECLRRVAPPHGCLSFERFVAGLRFSLLNNRSQQQQHSHSHSGQQKAPHPGHSHPHAGCASQGSRGVENTNPAVKVRPLGPSNGVNTHPTPYPSSSGDHSVYASVPPPVSVAPGAPGRYGSGPYERTGRSLERIPVLPESSQYRAEPSRTGKKLQQQNRIRSIESLALESPQLQKPGGLEGGALPRSQSETTTGLAGVRRHGRSRDEQRRHTITNGVDYGMLKQMKELEQEKDSLLAGLEAVERARDWYQQQIHSVTERQRHVGQSAHCTDFFSDSSQSRLNVLLPKLQEVNRCLGDLISCSGMPFSASPTSLAPAGPSNPPHAPPSLPHPQQAIQRLKDQNRLLTKEVTDKSERITQLEQEKSALIKQLFEARSRSAQEGAALDSTFI